MGIQSEVGLISGIPIISTVDQLIAISARPRDTLQTRNMGLQGQQVAIGELMALTISIQLSANKLAEESVFQQRLASSSNDDALSAAVTGDAVAGTYQFTPIRAAQNHQMISGGLANRDDPLNAGEMTLQFGGFVDEAIDLDLLNSGAGIERGKIRITDRSGTSEVVDLRFALTIDDVLEQINGSEQINVAAVADGDSIRLIDQTGLTTANLKVQEVGLGTTAADLGLGAIDVAADEATGQDVLQLSDQINISQLNDENGLSIRSELPDLEITFRDGSATLQIELDPADMVTLGDVVDAINAADPTRLTAEIGPDGDRLVLTDLTTDSGGTFSIASSVGGSLAEDLGLATSGAADEITGARLLGGLKSPLLSSLSGGGGIGTLGQISLTDRSGSSANVDLSASETLDDVVDALNGSGLSITADVNDAGNGIVLSDTSGATISNFIVANGDATNSADKLNIAVDASQASVNSGSLALQVVHEGTTLASLNHGEGVSLGSILINDTAGGASGLNLRTSEAETVGDVIDLINGLTIGIEARINDTGDGILLLDTVGGSGKISITESGTGTTAADLGLLGESELADIDGTPTEVIDGTNTTSFEIEDGDTLEDLVAKINEADVGVSASIFESGSGSTPYRISLVSDSAGRTGEMLVDTSQMNLAFHTIIAPQDALLQVGSSDLPGAGVLVTSDNSRFENVIDGVQLTANGISDTPITIDVQTSSQQLISNVELFINQYNSLQDKLDELTYYSEESGATGILFGSNETLRIETTLSNLVTERFFGVGSVRSLEEIGIGVKDDGTIEFDQSVLKERFAEDPESLEQFFTDETAGFSTKFNAAIESLAGEENSLLVNRTESLQRKIDSNADRIEFLNDRLASERQRLLMDFYAMELAIGKIQTSMSAIDSIAALPSMISS